MEHTVLGERLHTMRRRKNLSQSELAAKAGVTVTTISGIESRGVDVRGSTLTVLAQVLDVSADYLLGICDDPEPCRTSRNPATARASPTPAAEDQATTSSTPPVAKETPPVRQHTAQATRRPRKPRRTGKE
jgi:transcriptional regulator with XRE-family HTH domain